LELGNKKGVAAEELQGELAGRRSVAAIVELNACCCAAQ
jgi:hypothetical protein